MSSFLHTLYDVNQGARGITETSRNTGRAFGAFSELTGVNIPLGGGYGRNERLGVLSSNIGYERRIAQDESYMRRYSNDGNYGYPPRGGNGYNYNYSQGYSQGPANYNYNYPPRGNGGYQYGQPGGYYERQPGYPVNQPGYPAPRPVVYQQGPDVAQGSRADPVQSMRTFAQLVYEAQRAGDQQAMQAAVNFALDPNNGIAQGNGMIYAPFSGPAARTPIGDLTWDGKPANAAQVAYSWATALGERGVGPRPTGPVVGNQSNVAPGSQPGTATGAAAPAATTQGGDAAPAKETRTAPADVPAGNGKLAHDYNVKKPHLKIQIDENQVEPMQRLFAAASPEYAKTLITPPPLKDPQHGFDGMVGFRFEAIHKEVCAKLGVDPAKFNYRDPQQLAQMTTKLKEMAGANVAPTVVTPPVEKPKLEQTIDTPDAIRGTMYDPNITGKMTQDQRNDVAHRGLWAVDEVASDKGTLSAETLARKMREVQKNNGLLQTGEADPQTLANLGMDVAERGGLAGPQGNVYRNAQSQAQADAAAAVALHALDKTSGVSRNPDVIQGKIEKFDEKAGLANDNGKVDAATLQKLEVAVAERGGLTPMDPNMVAALDQARAALQQPGGTGNTVPQKAADPSQQEQAQR